MEDRRYLLESFVKKLATLEHLWYSEENQIFVRDSNSEIDKSFSKLAALENTSLCEKYK